MEINETTADHLWHSLYDYYRLLLDGETNEDAIQYLENLKTSVTNMTKAELKSNPVADFDYTVDRMWAEKEDFPDAYADLVYAARISIFTLVDALIDLYRERAAEAEEEE